MKEKRGRGQKSMEGRGFPANQTALAPTRKEMEATQVSDYPNIV